MQAFSLPEVPSPTLRPRPGYSTTFPLRRRVLRAETPLVYFDEGPRHAPAVVFIHGLGGNVTHWEHVAPALAAEHRVIGMDLPGFGESAKPDVRYSIDLFVCATLGLMDALGVEDATLVGHSMGGQVAARLALEHPERVHRLALVDAAGFTRWSPPHRLAARVLFRRRVLAPLLERTAFQVLALTFYRETETVRHFLSHVEGHDPHPMVDEVALVTEGLRADLIDRHYIDHADRLRMPTLVVWGDKDRLIPVSGLRHWVHRLPNVRVALLPDCGHIPIIERPHAVIEELRRFLCETLVVPRAA